MRPIVLGVLTIWYGGLALAASVLAEYGPGPQAAMPVFVALALLAMAILGTATAPMGAPGRLDMAVAAIASRSGLLAAALVLSGTTVALLLARLAGVWHPSFAIAFVDHTPGEPAWVCLLFFGGLGIAGGAAIGLVRRPRSSSSRRPGVIVGMYGDAPTPTVGI